MKKVLCLLGVLSVIGCASPKVMARNDIRYGTLIEFKNGFLSGYACVVQHYWPSHNAVKCKLYYLVTKNGKRLELKEDLKKDIQIRLDDDVDYVVNN